MPARHFLTLLDLSPDELQGLMRRAIELKAKQHAGELYQPLRGKVLGMVFEKSSTRTRVSFEAGMSQLGGDAVRNALTRYLEHMVALAMTGDAVRLCPACRLMRGAAASGRLAREVIPIEGGGILLMTSPDPALVAMVRAEAGIVPRPQAKR